VRGARSRRAGGRDESVAGERLHCLSLPWHTRHPTMLLLLLPLPPLLLLLAPSTQAWMAWPAASGSAVGGKRETCMDQSVHFDLLESYPMLSMLLWARAASAGLVQASREGRRRRRRRRRPPPPGRRRWCSLDDDTRHPEVSVRSSTQPVAAPSHDRLQTPATWLARRHGSRRS